MSNIFERFCSLFEKFNFENRYLGVEQTDELRDWDRLFLLFQINHDIVNSTHDFSENTNDQLMSRAFLTFAEAL